MNRQENNRQEIDRQEIDRQENNRQEINRQEMNRRIRRAYLRDKYKIFIFYALTVAVFYAVAFLYGYEAVMRNMLYAAELTMFCGVLSVLADYHHYKARCRSLYLALQVQEERVSVLPEAGSFPEKLYARLLDREEQEKRSLLTRYDEAQKEMADYYTMWTHQIKTPIAAMRLLLQGEAAAGQRREEGSQGEQRREERSQAGQSKEKDSQEREKQEEGIPTEERRKVGSQEARRQEKESQTEEQEYDRAKDIQKEQEELFKIEQYTQMALYFARLDGPSSDFLFREYDVREIVKQAVRKYSVLFLRSGLSFQMEEFEIRAVTDEKWLAFVVEQVFSNALKYTHRGGIAIYGSDAEGDRRQGRSYYLVIEDTGIGIRQSDLPRIFERGYTGYNGRQDKRSTGLGLYLCDRIMSKMSHSLRVRSVLGQGTKVILGFWQE